jgi:hypothetical protein
MDALIARGLALVNTKGTFPLFRTTSAGRLLLYSGAPRSPNSASTPPSATSELRAEEDRMGELLRRGRDDEEAQWAVAVTRGTAVEHSKGLAPEAARRAAIQNLSANIHHYDAESVAKAAKSAASKKVTSGTAQKAPPAQPPPPPTWGERLVEDFNSKPGPRLRLEGPTGRGNSAGLLFSVLREDSDDQLAAVEVVGQQVGREVDELRWLDTRLRPSQQDAITERLEELLADDRARATEAEGEFSPASSLTPLLRMLQRQGDALGLDPVRARQVRPTGIHGLAIALQDLSTAPNTSPSELATHLNDVGLYKVAEVLEDEAAVAYSSVSTIIDKVWEAADEAMPLVEVMLYGKDKVVDARAVVNNEVLVREEGRAGRKYALRIVTVKSAEYLDPNVAIIGEVPVGAKVYLLRDDDSVVRRSAGFIREIHDRFTDLEHTLRKAPELLTDVRHLLFLAGALLETDKCQGREQQAALRAFEQAKHHYDAARRMLVVGKPAAAANKIHEAMRRISTSAGHISQSCAAGQQALLPSTSAALSVSQADQEVLEGPP